jgi:hypothetical protein
MKNTKRPVKKSKDDTVSEVGKKTRTAPTSVTSSSKATGTKQSHSKGNQKGASSEAKAQKISGVSRSGASSVKNNAQTDKKFSTRKDRKI